jgi:hypothetical protein
MELNKQAFCDDCIYPMKIKNPNDFRGFVDALDIAGSTPEEVAYMLATVRHECADKWLPIEEHGLPIYFKKYIGKLGNKDWEDAIAYKGRGYVQLTGRSNYRRIGKLVGQPLEDKPDIASSPEVAMVILVKGMTQGWFTGLGFKSGNYTNFIKWRKIINGLDKAELIAGYAAHFVRLLLKWEIK